MWGTDRRIVNLAWPVCLIVALAGCMTDSQPQSSQAPQQPGLGPAERVASLLDGEYAAMATGEPASTVRLIARVLEVTPEGVIVDLRQATAGQDPRRFRLVLGPTRVASRLQGRFSPLDQAGQRLGECPIEVLLQTGGFIARTDAATCRFGPPGQRVALIKEIAHNGAALVVADRVVAVESGESQGPDRVLRFQPVSRFSGWAGVREEGGAWRIARALEIASDGVLIRPRDAGDMPLGIELELAPHEIDDDARSVLRLRVFDAASGALLGQSWADPRALALGIAVGDVQVGLNRQPENVR